MLCFRVAIKNGKLENKDEGFVITVSVVKKMTIFSIDFGTFPISGKIRVRIASLQLMFVFECLVYLIDTVVIIRCSRSFSCSVSSL